MRGLDAYFNQADLEAVRRAVDAAEGKTAGEIVPYVVLASDEYEGTLWRGAALGALLVPLVAAAIHELVGLWGPVLLWLALPAPLGAALGYLAAAVVPAVKRALTPAEVMARRVARRASVAFLEEEVFATAERTGILLFLSLFEHRVVVLGDSGINARVEAGEWQTLSDRLAAGIRAGRAAAALVEAVGECGRLLARRGVERRPDDRDELSDELRRRER